MIPFQTHIIVGVAAAAIGFGAGWQINGWRLNNKIDRIELRAANELAAATKKAMEDSAKLQRTKDEAIKQANERAQTNARAAAGARAERDRLREQLSSTGLALSSASCDSIRNYAAALSDVFGECSEELVSLAEKADGHASDALMFERAWPK